MSLRETRLFTEHLRVLGYPPISMESFRLPNFTLMADILSYLITTYDPRFQPSSYKTEPERIEFIKTIALYIVLVIN